MRERERNGTERKLPLGAVFPGKRAGAIRLITITKSCAQFRQTQQPAPAQIAELIIELSFFRDAYLHHVGPPSSSSSSTSLPSVVGRKCRGAHAYIPTGSDTQYV